MADAERTHVYMGICEEHWPQTASAIRAEAHSASGPAYLTARGFRRYWQYKFVCPLLRAEATSRPDLRQKARLLFGGNFFDRDLRIKADRFGNVEEFDDVYSALTAFHSCDK